VIRDDEYDGGGHHIRQALQIRRYVGINGLAHAGFCCTRPDLEPIYGRPAFPKLAMWLQKDVAELDPYTEAPPARERLRA
jgi:hypothetical protein